MNKKTIYILLFILASTRLFSQGLVENELTGNSVLIDAHNQLKEKGKFRMGGSITDTLTLGTKGIIDDFSKPGPYPDTSLWLTNYVFINNEYGKAPPTLGVATFDGLNYDGYPYDFAATSGSSGKADSLISKPIDLSPYPASDSLYFSFFYQPQGIGNAPEAADSLVVLFRQPGATSSWNRVWTKKGTTLATNDSSWKTVMIPITNNAYLQKGFQFCFVNYATRSGNVDHWNIDYVYLNRLRHKADSIFEDVAFVYDVTSMLNSYTEMPWKHFVASESRSQINTIVRNNHSVVKNVSFVHKVYDPSNTTIYTSPLSASNVDPFVSSGYYTYTAGSLPALPTLSNYCDYTFESIINSTPDFNRINDTLRHVQRFRYHYAYDDGTAESAFGLSTLNAKLAEKFTTTTDDTLRYIDIYFNPMMLNASVYTFRLKLWTDAGGYPGVEVFSSDSTFSPAYNHGGHNAFVRYPVEPPIYLNATTFHIGLQQNTNQFINIGVDKNTNTQSMISYNVSGTWLHSPYPGSLMMRPVFGSAADLAVSENEMMSATKTNIIIYPNPASDRLSVLTGKQETELISYSIYDLTGRMLSSGKLYSNESIDVANFSEGIYFIQLTAAHKLSAHKFVITK